MELFSKKFLFFSRKFLKRRPQIVLAGVPAEVLPLFYFPNLLGDLIRRGHGKPLEAQNDLGAFLISFGADIPYVGIYHLTTPRTKFTVIKNNFAVNPGLRSEERRVG